MSEPRKIKTGMTADEMRAEIERLKSEIKAKRGEFRVKVSQKGAVSVYGLGRFPVTLYGGQWERLLSHSQTITDFIIANRDKLTTKDDSVESAGA